MSSLWKHRPLGSNDSDIETDDQIGGMILITPGCRLQDGFSSFAMTIYRRPLCSEPNQRSLTPKIDVGKVRIADCLRRSTCCFVPYGLFSTF